jgi:hypothetical protein
MTARSPSHPKHSIPLAVRRLPSSLRCLYCYDGVRQEQALHRCASCGTSVHEACRREHGACPGCQAPSRAGRVPAAPAARRPRGTLGSLWRGLQDGFYEMSLYQKLYKKLILLVCVMALLVPVIADQRAKWARNEQERAAWAERQAAHEEARAQRARERALVEALSQGEPYSSPSLSRETQQRLQEDLSRHERDAAGEPDRGAPAAPPQHR